MRPQKAFTAFLAIAAFGLLLPGAGCRGPGPKSETPSPRQDSSEAPNGRLVSDAESLARGELIQADRAFAESVRVGRLDSWVDAFDENGMVLPAEGPAAVGPDAIRGLFMPLFAEPTFEITWVPAGAEAAGSGDFGYTFGDWKTSVGTPGGSLERAEGKYLTVWRKGADGRWRVLADIGNTQTQSPAGD